MCVAKWTKVKSHLSDSKVRVKRVHDGFSLLVISTILSTISLSLDNFRFHPTFHWGEREGERDSPWLSTCPSSLSPPFSSISPSLISPSRIARPLSLSLPAPFTPLSLPRTLFVGVSTFLAHRSLTRINFLNAIHRGFLSYFYLSTTPSRWVFGMCNDVFRCCCRRRQQHQQDTIPMIF